VGEEKHGGDGEHESAEHHASSTGKQKTVSTGAPWHELTKTPVTAMQGTDE
jgi:hypothetical protein